jgi:hypothetical protein
VDLAPAVVLRLAAATSLLVEQPPAVTPSLDAVVVAVEEEAFSVVTVVAVEAAAVAVAPRARVQHRRRPLLVAMRRMRRLECRPPWIAVPSSTSRLTTRNGEMVKTISI